MSNTQYYASILKLFRGNVISTVPEMFRLVVDTQYSQIYSHLRYSHNSFVTDYQKYNLVAELLAINLATRKLLSHHAYDA